MKIINILAPKIAVQSKTHEYAVGFRSTGILCSVIQQRFFLPLVVQHRRPKEILAMLCGLDFGPLIKSLIPAKGMVRYASCYSQKEAPCSFQQWSWSRS